MTIITITSPARCKDCKFIKAKTFGKARRHICTNTVSERYDPSPYLSQVALRDKVCSKWSLI
jgi:hypothetical protein